MSNDKHIDNYLVVKDFQEGQHPTVWLEIKSILVGQNRSREFGCRVIFFDRSGRLSSLTLFIDSQEIVFGSDLGHDQKDRSFFALIGSTLCAEALKDCLRDNNTQRLRRSLMFSDEQVAIFFPAIS